MIKTSIQYLLLLSFLLACLPGQNTHQQDFAKTKDFVVVMDDIQSLAPADKIQKTDKETEDPHPLVFSDLFLPDTLLERIHHFSSFILADAAAHYSIRGPPLLV